MLSRINDKPLFFPGTPVKIEEGDGEDELLSLDEEDSDEDDEEFDELDPTSDEDDATPPPTGPPEAAQDVKLNADCTSQHHQSDRIVSRSPLSSRLAFVLHR